VGLGRPRVRGPADSIEVALIKLSHRELVERLGAQAGSVLKDRLQGVQKYALVDFPNHSNVGDSAIWLGELAALRDIGLGLPSYVCDLHTFSPTVLRERVGNGPILIHGGGNFGDLWTSHQQLREQILGSAPDNPIVQLPQSIDFRDAGALERARAAVQGHPSFTLLVRDERSRARALHDLDVEAVLCPDLAFCLPPLDRPAAPETPVLWLMRTDHESTQSDRPGNTGGKEPPVDWLEEERRGWVRVSKQIAGIARAGGVAGALAQPIVGRVWTAAARQRLRRGLGVLARGRVVVTDRLHAHVLCLLMAVPHVVLPDRHGKIQSFIETWTSEADHFEVAGDSGSAAVQAERLLVGHA
jgi:exopolysaccharide biosynthesis predicted pyruvyltransferase EpsI